MNAVPQPNAASTLRDVRRGVAEAADAKVLQVVRMVDSLDVRGATDELLSPVRARLRSIQPPRPLRFARLLFMPADPLIVPPRAWRAGSAFLPRNAVAVFADAVRLALARSGAGQACLARTDQLIAGVDTSQVRVVRTAGTMLWPEAASALRDIAADPPTACAAAWAAGGLPASELPALAGALAGILAVAVPLHDHDHSGAMLQDSELAKLLATGAALGQRAWGMLLSLLVIRAPQASAALFAAATTGRMPKAASQAAAEAALVWLEAETDTQIDTIPAGAAAELNRQTSVLDVLSAECTDPVQRRRLSEARARLLTGTLSRLETALQDCIAAPLAALPDSPDARHAALDAMEASARALRSLDLEGRRLGATARFDGLVRSAEVSIGAQLSMAPMERARLMEILVGAEAAMRMLA